ncbi:MAG: type I-E CRISPR-associated protein Cse1/CasA [Deltaproteobacteria bacterium]|jgi:CRISPR system Cascade subunit CasA|nr:type I-E CRISPR-associated protein Cse1/CasA [Deltaproteobacteria bacterium]MDD3620334.1 type I-E CRISPR-associated protein Cse1/CasA [Desulfobulbaceae bacterium]
MNLLTEPWIPVRPLPTGQSEKITLQELLCRDGKWELCLPRDDMELAALQLLICMAQVFFTPKNVAELKKRIVAPVPPDAFATGIAPYREWFRLDHPDFPFMQLRGVQAKEPTPMDKLLAGVTGATNSCFVNEPGLGNWLCGGCVAIALFNQASNAPSFGGGFKGSLRGGAPITTLVQGEHLRQTIWLNVLSFDKVMANFPWHNESKMQPPTWVEPIKAGDSISAQRIDLFRGLFWQPAHIELLASGGDEQFCCCCGGATTSFYTGFNKAKFNYTVSGLWPHPHGARTATVKKGERKERFLSFTTTAPAWTQLSRFVVQREIDGKDEGQEPAAVIRQAQGLIRSLKLNAGGYRNNQASILERRHESIFLNDGWSNNTGAVHELVGLALGYRDALNKALYVFFKGLKEVQGAKVKGSGVSVHEVAKEQFYRRSEDTVLDTLANIDFSAPTPALRAMREKLHRIAVELFEDGVRPYLNDPELVRTMAVSRKTLFKHLHALKPQQDRRNDHGTQG